MTERTMNRWTLILCILAFLAALLVQPADAGAILTPEQQQAAEVAAGEAPASLVGADGFRGVVCTMVARLESPRFPDTLLDIPADISGDIVPGVLRAYYAKPRTLTAVEADIAADVFTGATDCGPQVYALGGGDVRRWGLRAGDVVTGQGRWTVHLYQDNPWGG